MTSVGSNCSTVRAKVNKRKLCKQCHNNYNDENNKVNSLKDGQLIESINIQTIEA